VAGLRPEKRKRIARRVKAQSSDTYDIQTGRQELGTRTRQLHKEIASERGATAAAQRSVGTVPTNLGGPEGRQLRQEIRGREKDLSRGLPALIGAAQSSFKSDRADILAGIQQAQFSRRQDITSAIQDVLEHQRKEAADRAQNQAEKKQGVDSALIEAKRLISEQRLVNADPEADPDRKRPPVPQTAEQWIEFENKLRTIEGIDVRSARKAVKRLQRAVVRDTRQAVTPSPGVYRSRPPGRF
jgi:hypothetical protein